VRWIEVAYWRVQCYLPSNIRSKIESLILRRPSEERQLRKLDMLGKNIGLSRSEVLATYNPPLNMSHWRSRFTPFSACVMILVIMVVGYMIIAFVALSNPNYFPPPNSTYRFGSLYGTIKPQDFGSAGSSKRVVT
jgi:hypothetical protein